MSIYRLGEHAPVVPVTAWVAPNATVVGRVTLGADNSVWFGAVLRGDSDTLTLGDRVNVQDNAVLHADSGFPLVIEHDVTIGHQAMVHGCHVEAGCLIGIQAVVLNGARIGAGSLVGAGALVTEGKVFPPRSLIVGSPAKLLRELTEEESARLRQSAAYYAQNGVRYGAELEAVA
ncbi:gamma carbonic anhydrase family protein [Inhella gelatinilytica]|uniref:Gamma carbonic anhydrase family protein n=1 Tax=Inhella gelatinilytica TaxID=2795030 RepID=A0A931IZN0_9BURK|nr:gamma carbonic anhydrase family protein [Inhella gelatinilytica]MBH9552893.1 gamma carbonic anhydrase family protein [Inhella gelatinilytica]